MNLERDRSTPIRPLVSSAAEAVWLRYLARELAGERTDFERVCAEHAELADELRCLQAEWGGGQPVATPPPPRKSEPIDGLLRRLAVPAPRAARYQVEGEIARGGMGVVQRVWDADLGRHLALKTLRVAPGCDGRHVIARFVEEAQVAAQLDHPAIVPVHDVGVDALGRPFFVMKLVEGHDLRHVFEQAWNSEEGWSTTRVLGVLLRVCEAVGYAHKKGVIHRDLKPSNVMVGAFGEVYVMDWGVARVLGSCADEGAAAHPVTTVRTVAGSGETDSALLTSEGEVIGTAAYMSPEQARGEIESLTAQSDVYAVGAMLYHLLARRAPHASDGASSAQVLERVRSGPPPTLAYLVANVAPELVAICAKAMAREPARRYADLAELADDLRAYLEGRVVRAHRTGAWASARKWVGRNRALSTSVAVLLAILALVGWLTRRSAIVRADFDAVARLRQPTELLADYDALWPATPANLPAMERWLAAAEDAAAHVDEQRAELARLRERALPWDELSPAERRARRDIDARVARTRRYLAYLDEQHEELMRTGAPETWEGQPLADLEAQIARDAPSLAQRLALRIERQTWDFASPADQLLHDRLAALIPDVERLAGTERGYSRVERVRRAIAAARESVHDDAATWERAQREIADRERNPHYDGLVLAPQLGLLPLGPAPRSGLWEFAHLPSGAPARRGPDGELELGPDTGVVLVLLPGARYVHGAQALDAAEPNFDPHARADEGPPQRVVLDPFFIAKFEMTASQWQRWTGFDSCTIAEALPVCESGDVRLRPVETVSWWECERVVRELGLCLPTEAQWEYAARGGERWPWSAASELGELFRFGNVLDPCSQRILAQPSSSAVAGSQPDGFAGTAPVGSYTANRFGLHDTLGNVAEWCADIGAVGLDTPRYLGTGARAANADHGQRVFRGGHCFDGPLAARVAARCVEGPNHASCVVGLRPARALDP